MPMPGQTRDFDIPLCVATPTITGGGVCSVASPTRGEILAVYLTPVAGGAITGTATLTISVNGVSGATVAMAAAAAGQASGAMVSTGVTLSARQFVNESDVITLTLGSGMTGTGTGQWTVIVRARSI